MRYEKFINSDTGRIVASIILGLGIATFFREICKGKHCVVTHALPMKEVDGQIYKYEGKCYKYSTSQVPCNKNKKIYTFA